MKVIKSGYYLSKRGVKYRYNIYDDYSIEQYKSGYDYLIRKPGGHKYGNDVFIKPTKEIKKYIKEVYGIEVR